MAEVHSKKKNNQITHTSIKGKTISYFIRHIQVFLFTLGTICRSPFASLMTTAVIGIALALPAGLHLILKNFEAVTANWDGAAQISLFLKKDISEEKVQKLTTDIAAMDEIENVSYISADMAMEEFKKHSGFGSSLDALDNNPLPDVLVIKPAIHSSSPEKIQRLMAKFRKNGMVDIAQLDMEWIKRLYSIMDVVRDGIWIAAALLAIAVLLVVGNTIRLDIQNKKEEILINKLIGATDAFIRRPFLYTGFWYGIIGGAIAFTLITVSIFILSDSINNLSGLYGGSFTISGLGISGLFILLITGLGLGLSGSWIAVGRHLKQIEPS